MLVSLAGRGGPWFRRLHKGNPHQLSPAPKLGCRVQMGKPTVENQTKRALLGPGKPRLPVAFLVSREGIEAKYVGAAAADRALDWIERNRK